MFTYTVHSKSVFKWLSPCFVIDHEAREVMYLVASVRLSDLSQLNRLTYDLDIWYVGLP